MGSDLLLELLHPFSPPSQSFAKAALCNQTTMYRARNYALEAHCQQRHPGREKRRREKGQLFHIFKHTPSSRTEAAREAHITFDAGVCIDFGLGFVWKDLEDGIFYVREGFLDILFYTRTNRNWRTFCRCTRSLFHSVHFLLVVGTWNMQDRIISCMKICDTMFSLFSRKSTARRIHQRMQLELRYPEK